MSTTAHTADLCSRIEALVQEHIAASHKAAMATLQRAFASSATPSASRSTQRRGKQSSGTYRSREVLSELQDKIYDFLNRSPGVGATEISTSLGISAKDMHRPMAKLKKSGLVRSVGQRSETRYFPVS
jgi:predicted HTH transcriptional regulator